jgi:hypothetical protein
MIRHKISNIEQGMMNDERERNGRVGSPGAVDGVGSSENAGDACASSFDIHHSLFDIRYCCMDETEVIMEHHV